MVGRRSGFLLWPGNFSGASAVQFRGWMGWSSKSDLQVKKDSVAEEKGIQAKWIVTHVQGASATQTRGESPKPVGHTGSFGGVFLFFWFLFRDSMEWDYGFKSLLCFFFTMFQPFWADLCRQNDVLCMGYISYHMRDTWFIHSFVPSICWWLFRVEKGSLSFKDKAPFPVYLTLQIVCWWIFSPFQGEWGI